MISMRRLLYYHYINNLDDKSTLKNMIELTEEYPTKGDWASSVQDDFKTFNIIDPNQFIQLSKLQARKLVKNKVKSVTGQYLKQLADNSKKAAWIKTNDLKMSTYLKSNHKNFSILQKRKIFNIRSQMSNIGQNYPNRSQGPNCLLGCDCVEDLEHLLNCPF